MIRLTCYLSLLLGSTLALPAWSATVLKHQNQQGQTQQATITETKARLESGQPNRYMILDLAANKMYAVEAQQQKVLAMEVSAEAPAMPAMPNMPNMPQPPEIKSDLVVKGSGPNMLGYETQQVQITANGELCSDNYVAAAALEVPYLSPFLNTMAELTRSRQSMMKMAMAFSPCLTAQAEQEEALMAKGVVLKSVDGQGQLLHEIIQIETDVTVEPQLFSFPDSYQVVSEQQLMQERMQQMQQMQQQFGGQQPPQMMPNQPGMQPPQYRPMD
jgi:hypothetical protein